MTDCYPQRMTDWCIWDHARICSEHGWVWTKTGLCPKCHRRGGQRCLACGDWIIAPPPAGGVFCECMVGRVVVFERLGDAITGVCTDADGPWLRLNVEAEWYAVRRDEVLAVVVGTGRPVTTVVRDDWQWDDDER